jgi:DNA adenine methylase
MTPQKRKKASEMPKMSKKYLRLILWFGGKGNMLAKLLPIINGIKHTTYCEPFGGGASILLNKQPSKVEVYNDLDSGLYDFFSVLANPEQFEKFRRRVSLLPYSRQLYYDCCDTWQQEADIIERASKWFVVARQSFSGRFGSGWSFAVTASRRNMAETCSKWLSCIEHLPEVHTRLQRVQIENIDFKKCIDCYDTDETLFYLDPPYLAETRSAGGYKHELTAVDHAELIEILLNLRGQAVLSGYPNEIYNRLTQSGWEYREYETACHAAGKTRNSNLQGKGAALENAARTEAVWIKRNSDNNLF